MVNMCAAANSHQSRMPAAADVCVCVRSRPANAGHAEALANFLLIDAMWEAGSVVCVVAVNCRVAARRLRAT